MQGGRKKSPGKRIPPHRSGHRYKENKIEAEKRLRQEEEYPGEEPVENPEIEVKRAYFPKKKWMWIKEREGKKTGRARGVLLQAFDDMETPI